MGSGSEEDLTHDWQHHKTDGWKYRMNHAGYRDRARLGETVRGAARRLVITPDGTAKEEKDKLIQCHHYTIVCNNSSAL